MRLIRPERSVPDKCGLILSAGQNPTDVGYTETQKPRRVLGAFGESSRILWAANVLEKVALFISAGAVDEKCLHNDAVVLGRDVRQQRAALAVH